MKKLDYRSWNAGEVEDGDDSLLEQGQVLSSREVEGEGLEMMRGGTASACLLSVFQSWLLVKSGSQLNKLCNL